MVSSFAGIENASIGGSSSRNFEPGLYTLRLDGLKVVDSKKAPGTRFVIVECNVRDFTPGVVPHLDETLAPTPVSANHFREGDEVAWKVNLSMASALDNLKSFGLTVLRSVAIEAGQDPKEVTEVQITPEVMDTLFSPNGSPAIGLELRAEAFNIFTRAGNPFTKVRWSTVAR